MTLANLVFSLDFRSVIHSSHDPSKVVGFPSSTTIVILATSIHYSSLQMVYEERPFFLAFQIMYHELLHEVDLAAVELVADSVMERT